MTDRCGAVDLDDNGRGTGAVCSAPSHSGSTHTDQSRPDCIIQWSSRPTRTLTSTAEPERCWARAEHRVDDDGLPTPCNDRNVAAGGLCAAHAERFGIVAV